MNISILVTAFEKGGIKRQLCSKRNKQCWSLHSLWDAEMLKIDEHEFMMCARNEKLFDVTVKAEEMSQILCLAYDYPEYYKLENYVIKYRGIMKKLVVEAAAATSDVLNSRIQYPGTTTLE